MQKLSKTSKNLGIKLSTNLCRNLSACHICLYSKWVHICSASYPKLDKPIGKFLVKLWFPFKKIFQYIFWHYNISGQLHSKVLLVKLWYIKWSRFCFGGIALFLIFISTIIVLPLWLCPRLFSWSVSRSQHYLIGLQLK